MSWFSAGPVMWQVSVTSLILAFALSQAIAGTYVFTFSGLSYARSLVQGMALGSIITCMLMLAIGDSVAAGIGIAGGLSIIRFRTTMRDPRDMVFIFASLAVGIVCGLQAHAAALAGTAVFCTAGLVLHGISYGTRHQHDGLIRFSSPLGVENTSEILRVFKKHTRSHVLVTLREAAQGQMMEQAYQVQVPDNHSRNLLVDSLQSIDGVQDVTLHMQEPTLEL